MTTLFAQPYDISATGFYFTSTEEYADRAAQAVNDCGGPVEEFEIQFIDGEEIDCALGRAWELNQANFSDYFEAVEGWSESDKITFIIAVGECGYTFDPKTDDPGQFDVDLYEVETLGELAQRFVDEGLFGEIPERLSYYIDHDAVARDLACDYSMIEVAGTRYAYRCV